MMLMPIQSFIRRARRRVAGAHAAATLTPKSRSVIDENLTYLGTEKLARLERAANAALLEGPPGDALEFGVALGGSGIVIARIAIAQGRAFHGFDVFGTIPPPTSDKDDEKSKRRYQVIASGSSSGLGGERYYGYRDDLYGDVCRTFARHGLGVDGSRIVLHRGLFEHTWPDYRSHDVAFAHIDCDWYDPVKFCLESVAERMGRHARIVIDDYHDYGGCRAATDEFLQAHPDFDLDDGANAILIRN